MKNLTFAFALASLMLSGCIDNPATGHDPSLNVADSYTPIAMPQGIDRTAEGMLEKKRQASSIYIDALQELKDKSWKKSMVSSAIRSMTFRISADTSPWSNKSCPIAR